MLASVRECFMIWYKSLAQPASNPADLETRLTYLSGLAYALSNRTKRIGSVNPPSDADIVFWRGYIDATGNVSMYEGRDGNYPNIRVDDDGLVLSELVDAIITEDMNRARLNVELDPGRLDPIEVEKLRRTAKRGRIAISGLTAQKLLWVLYSGDGPALPLHADVADEAYHWRTKKQKKAIV